MMPDPLQPLWSISDNVAHSERGAARISARLMRPRQGLGITAPGLARSPAVLAVELPDLDAASAGRQMDGFVRGEDLIAVYDQLPHSGFRTQIDWRNRPVSDPRVVLCLELLVSLQTELLDTRPSIQALSRVVGESAWELALEPDPSAKPVELAAGADRVLAGDVRRRGLLLRLNERWSYFEAVHPLDADQTTLSISEAPDKLFQFEWRHRLMTHALEKGVMLRSRVLGLLLVRQDDVAVAASEYHRFVEACLPLTA